MHFFTTPKRVMRYVLALIACSLTTLSVYAMPAPDYASVTALPQCSSISAVNLDALPSQLAWGTNLELSFSPPNQSVASSDLVVYEVDATGTPIANGATHTIPALTIPNGYGAFNTTGADASQTTSFAMLFVHKDAAGNAVCRSHVSLTQFQGVATDVLGVQVGANGTEICSTIGQTFATSATNPEWRTAGEAVEVSFSNGNTTSQAGRLIVRDVNTNEQFTVPANVNGSNGVTNIVSNGFPGQQNRTVEVFFEHTVADGGAVVCRSNSKFINFSTPQTENFSSEVPAEEAPVVVVENCKRVFYLDGSEAFATIPAGATRVSGNHITGSSCDDTIYGNGEDNVLKGLGGDDTIFGFDGDDTIKGGAGDDNLYGGDAPCPEDDDTCVEASNTGNDTINGDAGDDTIYGGNEECPATGPGPCKGGQIGDTISGGDGDDTIYGGDESCDGINCDDGVHLGDDIDGGNGDDKIFGGDETCENNGRFHCDAGAHIGDDIEGGSGNDKISGGNEACQNNAFDSCDGGATHVGDIIDGGSGNDVISGGNETCDNNANGSCDRGVQVGDVIEGGTGDDTIVSGDETCDNNGGGSCDENAQIGDVITDTAPDDTDTIDAGAGDDTVDVADGDTNDTVTNAEDVTNDAPSEEQSAPAPTTADEVDNTATENVAAQDNSAEIMDSDTSEENSASDTAASDE